MRYCLDICEEQSRMVKVTYSRYDKTSVLGSHFVFTVSSLSRPGKTHVVYIAANPRYYIDYPTDQREAVEGGYLKLWSSDEWYKYGGCAYFETQAGIAMLPEFRVPTESAHDCFISHTVMAAVDFFLKYFGKEEESAVKEGFSKVMVWFDDDQKYRG